MIELTLCPVCAGSIGCISSDDNDGLPIGCEVVPSGREVFVYLCDNGHILIVLSQAESSSQTLPYITIQIPKWRLEGKSLEEGFFETGRANLPTGERAGLAKRGCALEAMCEAADMIERAVNRVWVRNIGAIVTEEVLEHIAV